MKKIDWITFVITTTAAMILVVLILSENTSCDPAYYNPGHPGVGPSASR